MNRRTLLVLPVALLSGCAAFPVTVSQTKINTKIYRNTEDFLERIRQLHLGMPSEEALHVMGVTKETTMQLMSQEDIRAYEFAQISPRTIRDAEESSIALQSYSGLLIQYADTDDKGWLSPPFHYWVHQMGFTLTAVLVFRDHRLYSRRPAGKPKIDVRTRRILFGLMTDFASIRNVTQ